MQEKSASGKNKGESSDFLFVLAVAAALVSALVVVGPALLSGLREAVVHNQFLQAILVPSLLGAW